MESPKCVTEEDREKASFLLNKSCINPYFDIVNNEELGEHLVASKDVKAGTILWKEKPLSTGPMVPEILKEQGVGSCPGCYSLVALDDMIKCNKCQWLVCSEDCEKFPEHKDNECCNQLGQMPTQDMKKLQDFAVFSYRIALLKTRDLATYNQIMDMKHSPQQKCGDMMEMMKKMYIGAERLVLKLTNVSDKEYEKIFNIMKLNGTGLSIHYDDPSIKVFGLGLYKTAALLFHSCRPNCGVHIQPAPSHELRVHAAIDMKAGEVLTRFYREKMGGPTFIGGTAERQRLLLEGGYYTHTTRCKCELCSDPYEMGTNMSTLVCSRCKEPSMIPKGIGRLLKDWVWHCKTRGCQMVIRNAELDGMHKEISILSKIVPMTESQFKQCSKRWPQLRDDYRDKVHPNYWAIVAGARELCRQYCDVYMPPPASPDWNYHQEIMEYLLQIFDVIRPGISLERARIKHNLAKTWFTELYMADLPRVQQNPGPENMQDALKKLDKVIEWEKEAQRYFEMDEKSEINKIIKMTIEQCKKTRINCQQVVQRASEIENTISSMWGGGRH